MTKYVVPYCIEYFASLTSSQSINVMECPEFRSLLLVLRPELADKDIPRRTKLRESVIKAWEAWFNILKEDLSVSLIIVRTQIIHSNSEILACCRQNFFHS